MRIPTDRGCSACGTATAQPFFVARAIPTLVCVLHADEAAARACTRGDIELVSCPSCGLIENRCFEPERVVYGEGYENSLHFSEFFQGYIREFAQDLVTRHSLETGVVLEIGCGDGAFLKLLVELGVSRAVGLDPSYPEGLPTELEGGRVQIRRAYWSTEEARLECDLIVCRQVLEHMTEPLAFLESLREGLGERPTLVCMEVPNAHYPLRELSLWDIVYEHKSYFSQGSLARLFARAGFDVLGARETFARQFLAVEARPARGASGRIPAALDDLGALAQEVERFARLWPERVESWRTRLSELAERGATVALWGAGARGVGFLNLADPTGVIREVVDINPRKHGLHVAGSGQRIASPEALRASRPELVVIMNPNYQHEIEASLRELGLAPEVVLA